MLALSQLEVLAVDCQATAAAPRGHLLELGWARVGPEAIHPHASLIRLPPCERVPAAVARITGISDAMARSGVDGQAAWRELAIEAARISRQPAPAIAHFARFEEPFLRALAGGVRPFDLVCTHEIARRLLPDLPRCSLRAVTGYFGRAVGTLRRSADHVEATAFIWRELVRLLDGEGISTWRALQEWLESAEQRPNGAAGRRRRVWPMPRELRLAAPDAPGVYRMLRTSGDVLYVGKASSLKHRVNSYFRKQHGIHERTLEMLSQARGVSFQIAPSALEAALLECDEIKRLRPPYNVALAEDREVWFAPRDVSERSLRPSARCPVGPFPSAQTIDQFVALAHGRREALGDPRWGPDQQTFDEGIARFRAAHRELSCAGLGPHARLLRLGARLWREGRRDSDLLSDDGMLDERRPLVVQAFRPATGRAAVEGGDAALSVRFRTAVVQPFRALRPPYIRPEGLDYERPATILKSTLKGWTTSGAGARAPRSWTPEHVQLLLERIALRAVLALRRARWLTQLVDATLVWAEPGSPATRMIVIENGDVALQASVEPGAVPPVPPGWRRARAARHQALTIARFDRLRVLTTELKRLVAEGGRASLRFGEGAPLEDTLLARALSRV